MTKTTAAVTRTLTLESETRLRKLLRRNSTLNLQVTHVSRSGMSRYVRVWTVSKKDLVEITIDVARVLRRPIREGKMGRFEIVMGGCGYSVTEEIGQDLSRLLFKDPRSLTLSVM